MSDAYYPLRKGHAADPSPDGETWPNCGHPKTPENTQHIGKAGDRCRLCRRQINRESERRRRERKRKRRNG